MSTKPTMAPTTTFYLGGEDTDTETEGYSSGARDLNPICASEAPRSLLAENYHTHPSTETESFPEYIERMPEVTKVVKGFGPIGMMVGLMPEPVKEKKEKTTYDRVPLGTFTTLSLFVSNPASSNVPDLLKHYYPRSWTQCS
jgi:hypothetical protein